MSEDRLFQNLPLLAAAAVAIVLGAQILQGIYLAFFHPLSKLPGPRIAGASALPFLYHRLVGRQHRYISDLHEKYGPTVRYLPDTVSFVQAQAWRDIYGHKSQGTGDMPKDIGIMAASLGGKHSILFMNDADHSRARRLVSHSLSDKAIREQRDILDEYVQMLVEKVRNVATTPGGGEIDINLWFNFTTFDVIADLSFGEPLGMLRQGAWTPWLQAINRMIAITSNIAVATRYLPALGWFMSNCLPASAYEPIKMHIKYSTEQVDKRLARDTERPDFWKFILRNQGKNEGVLSPPENHAMGMTLMVAGSETTATLLTGLTNLLLNNPDKFDKLRAEVRGAFSSPDAMDMDNLSRLPYLFACLEEGLRLYPPVPIGQQRLVPQGGRMVGDLFMPEGISVTVSHWAAYRYSENWHLPNEFHPERWLSENRKAGPFANDSRDVLQPFSFGPRNCIGKNLAYHEMRLILANMVWNFDFKLCEESKNWENQKVYGLPIKKPLMVSPTIAVHAEK